MISILDRSSVLFFSLLSLCLLLLNVPSAMADKTIIPEDDGAIHLKGQVQHQRFALELGTRSDSSATETLQAIKIYSQPSNTFLFALTSSSADNKALIRMWSILGEVPMSMISTDLSVVQSRVVMQTPPEKDNKIRIEKLFYDGKSYRTVHMITVKVSSIDQFEFSVTPKEDNTKGRGYNWVCAWCAADYCGCEMCGVEYTVCCPSCSITNGYVICP
ncbi:MAG: hypothetical protein JRF33_11120 [Deltaproteobacteria bacterium]|nr:hypothetical protein [Deltaproteobacteria bacterium]